MPQSTSHQSDTGSTEIIGEVHLVALFRDPLLRYKDPINTI